jgi:hypothetical protein
VRHHVEMGKRPYCEEHRGEAGDGANVG